MKKIIGALLVGAMIGGAAFAELNSSLNVRAGGEVFSKTVDKDNLTWFDLNSVTGTDAFTFKAANEYAGVTLNYNPILGVNKIGDALWPTSAARGFWLNGTGVELTGYVKPASWLKLQIGAHKDGIFFAEQCKKDTDDTNWSAAGKYAFRYKLGLPTSNSTANFIDSLTDVMNGGQQYFMADFTFADVGPGTLGIRATVVDTVTTKDAGKNAAASTQYNWIKDPDSKATMYGAPGVMVSYTVKDTIKANIDFQMPTSNDLAFGLFVSPLMVKNLTGVLGFSMSTVLDKEKDALGKKLNGNGVTYGGVDLRLRYVIDKFSIANALNFSFATEDAAFSNKGNSQLWDSIFALYKLNDKVWISFNFQADCYIQDDPYINLDITPGVVYNVGKGAAITAGLYVAVTDVADNAAKHDKNATALSLPVIFRVKL